MLVLAVCRVGEDAGHGTSILPPEAWGRLAAMAVLGLVARRRLVLVACWLAVAAAAFQCGGGFSRRLDSQPAAVAPSPWAPCARIESPLNAVLRVRARARVSAVGRWSVPATLVHATVADSAGTTVTTPRPLYLRGDGEAPVSGGLLLAPIVVRPPARAAVPDGFDTAAWLAGRGIDATARTDPDRPPLPLPGGGSLAALGASRDRLQTGLRDLLARGLPPRELAIAGGVLLGGGTSSEQRDSFARLGLAHLFALSGLHVGILAGLCLLALRPFAAGPTFRLLVLGPLLAAYVVLVDLPASVVRAAGLVALALLGPVAGRRLDSLRLLGLLLWANVLWQPAALLDTGTRLSYLAAGGIVAGQRVLRPWCEALPRGRRGLVAALGVTVAAQLATLPEVARSFGYLPVAGPVANLLLVPVFGLIVSLLATGLLASAVWPWAGEGVLAWAWLLLRPLAAGTALAAGGGAGLEIGLPAWGLGRSLTYGGLVVLLAVALRHRRRRAWAAAAVTYVAIIGLAAWRPPTAGGPDAWQFAVGQGDAALLRFPDGWTCLVDTGEAWRSGGGPLQRDVLPFLRRHGVARLDAVVLTHGHADHTGGRQALTEAVDVDGWFTGGNARPGPGRHRRPAAGDTLHVAGDWSLVCLHPGDLAADHPDENDRSVVLGLCRDGSLRGLWTGDLERGGEGELLPRLPPVPDAGLDVLKAGHHGSATSSSGPLLARLRPRLVLISCGVANRHGHPSHGPYVAGVETLAIGRTDLQGTVHLRWDAAGRLRARAMRPLALRDGPPSLDTP